MNTDERDALNAYNMYGFRQEEFSHLPEWAQEEVVEYCHAMAIMIDYAKSFATVAIMPSGMVITRGMIDEEIRDNKARTARLTFTTASGPWVIGLNASSNMFA